jgi:hypothetical protein
MSNNAAWHHKVPSAEQLQHALEELESAKRTSSNGGQSR